MLGKSTRRPLSPDEKEEETHQDFVAPCPARDAVERHVASVTVRPKGNEKTHGNGKGDDAIDAVP